MSSKNKSKKATKKRKVVEGIATVLATFSNTIVTITDPAGNALSWSSAGSQGFSGSRKSTPFAAQKAATAAGEAAQNDYGVKILYVRTKGPGVGRESAVRVLANMFIIKSLKDTTRIPHNGCRPKKRRRV